MLQTRKGSNDCLVVEQFYKDQIYQVSYSLGIYFTSKGYAEEVAEGCNYHKLKT